MVQRILETQELSVELGGKEILKDINLSIGKGEVVALLGPSGSGKSTLLRCLNGLEKFQKGNIFFHGDKVQPFEQEWQKLRPKIGMVFQSYDLFPNKTVLENCLLAPQQVQHRKKNEVEQLALGLLERVGLSDKTASYPHQLSGGQKQRVAIVRCLCMQPEMILLDEITAALDPEMVREVLEVILELAKEDTTMLIVTHELAFARSVSDRVIFLEAGEIVEESATKDFFQQPATSRGQEFLQSLDLNYL